MSSTSTALERTAEVRGLTEAEAAEIVDDPQRVRSLPSPVLYILEEVGKVAAEVLDERVIAWTEQGWSQRKIAEEIGCQQPAVSKRQARLGITAAGPQAGKTGTSRRDDSTGIIRNGDPIKPGKKVALIPGQIELDDTGEPPPSFPPAPAVPERVWADWPDLWDVPPEDPLARPKPDAEQPEGATLKPDTIVMFADAADREALYDLIGVPRDWRGPIVFDPERSPYRRLEVEYGLEDDALTAPMRDLGLTRSVMWHATGRRPQWGPYRPKPRAARPWDGRRVRRARRVRSPRLDQDAQELRRVLLKTSERLRRNRIALHDALARIAEASSEDT